MSLPLLMCGHGNVAGGGGAPAIGYHLRAEFAGILGAPLSSPLAVEDGTLVIVQGDGDFSTADGYLKNTAQSTPAAGDLYARSSTTIARAAGQIAYAVVNPQTTANTQIFGMNQASTGVPTDTQHVFRFAAGNMQTRSNTTTAVSTIELPASSDHEVAVALRASGAHFLERRNGESVWRHLYVGHDGTFDGYLTWAVGSETIWAACLRVYDEADVSWTATPLASDSFDGSDGPASATTDGLGVEETGGGSVSWTAQSGTFEIATNELTNTTSLAIRTLDAGEADIVAICDVTTIAGAVGVPGFVLRFSDTDNYWRVDLTNSTNLLRIVERNAGVETVRDSVGVTVADSTTYRILATCEGQTIWGMFGTAQVDYASAALNESATLHGLYGNQAGHKYNNFAIFERFPSDFPTEVTP